MEKYDPNYGIDPTEQSVIEAATKITDRFYAHNPTDDPKVLGEYFTQIYSAVAAAVIKFRTSK
jgi:hypothetical protein